jgi:hypothetical protein
MHQPAAGDPAMPINPEDDMEASASQTSSARERGFKIDRHAQDFGAADSDPDGVGDIADEGAAHRDVRPAEARPTPGSAEGERNPQSQSDSNVPRVDDGRHQER